MKLTPFNVTLVVTAVAWVVAFATTLGVWAYYEQKATDGYPTSPLYQQTDWNALAASESLSASIGK